MVEDDSMMMMDDEIPRNRQLILLWGGAGGVGAAGRYTDHDIWSPYNPGTSHQNGSGILHEPWLTTQRSTTRNTLGSQSLGHTALTSRN